MSGTATNTLVLELDADAARMERKISDLEARIAKFETSATKVSDKAGAGAQAMGQRYANASLQISQATETIARQGKVTGEAAKQMLNQAGQMAFAFGAGGAVAGAIAITTLAVVQLFTKARDEMEETARAFDEKLAGMRRSSNLMGAAETRQLLYSGDRFATRGKDESAGALKVRQVGLAGLDKAIQDNATRLAEIQRLRLTATREERIKMGEESNRLGEEIQAMQEARKQGSELRRQYEEATKAVNELAAAEGERAKNRLARERAEEAAAAAKKSGTEAARDAKQFAEDIAKLQHNLGLLDIGKLLKEGTKEAEAFTLEMQGLAAEMTPTLVDDMRVALEQLIVELEKKGVGRSFIADVRKWKESLVGAQETSEEFTAAMAKMQAAAKEGTLKPMGEMSELSQWESRIKAQIAALGTAKETEAARKVLGELLNQIEKRRGELIDGNNKKTEKGAQSAQALASGIAAAANFAYGLAQAFGVGNQALGQMITGIAQVANGVSQVLSADWSKMGLGAQLGVVGAIAGGVIGFAQAMFGEDPQDAADRKVREENTAALERLTSAVGHLGDVNLSGSGLKNAAGLADYINAQISSRSRFIGGMMIPIAQLPGTKIDLKDWDPAMVAQLKEAATALGINLDGTVDSFQRLAAALSDAKTKLGEFNTDFDSQRAQWEAWGQIFGKKDAANNLGVLANVFGNMAPALQELFAGLNLSDVGDRESLRKRVQDLFTTMMAGGDQLDASALGDLTGSQLLDILKEIIGTLDELAPVAKSAGEQLKDALASIDAELEIMDVTDPGEQLQRRAGAYQALGGSLGQLFEGLDLTDPAAVAELDARVRALFEQLQNSPESVDLAGLSIEELIAALLDLDGAADAVAAGVQSAATAFNEAVGQLDIDREIYGETDPTKYASDVAGAAGANFGEIGAALDGIDLSTPEGRAKAKKALQDLYTANKDNPALVGGIRSVIKALNAIPSEAAPGEEPAPRAAPAGGRESIANAARGVTEAVGNRMADYLRAIEINTAEFVRLAGGRGSVPGFPMLPTPLVPPFVPTRGAAGSGGLVVTIQAFVTVTAPDGDDPRLWGQIVGDGVAQAVNEEFAPWFDAALKRGGNLDRPGVS